MIKSLQLKNLRQILSKFTDQESIQERKIHNLNQLGYQWKIFKIKNIQTYINNLETGIQEIERQLNIMQVGKKSLREEIQSSSIKIELLKQASNYFLELYNIDENVEYLKKHLQIIKCYSGTLSNDYISGLCQYTQMTGDYEELSQINIQMTKNKQSSLQKQVAMILFIHTKNEQYYEEYLQNEATVTNRNLDIQFHEFAAVYFENAGCFHTQNFHLEFVNKYQSSQNESIQLSSISNQH